MELSKEIVSYPPLNNAIKLPVWFNCDDKLLGLSIKNPIFFKDNMKYCPIYATKITKAPASAGFTKRLDRLAIHSTNL